MSTRLRAASRASGLDALEQGMVGAIVWAPFEIYALGTVDPALWWVTLTLFALIGLAIGATIAIVETGLARMRLGSWVTALVRALACLPVLTYGTHSLFQGAFASTLPGADSAAIWVPIVATAGIAVVMRTAALAIDNRPHRRTQLAIALLVTAVMLELANRFVKPSELDDLHRLLVFTTATTTALGLRLLRLGSGTPVILGPAFATSLSFALALGFGLATPKQRATVAAKGMHTRLLVHIVHTAFDDDNDGYSSRLGGADCDDHDPARHPAAREIPGNDIDENCDRIVDLRAPARPAERGSDEVGDINETTRVGPASPVVRHVVLITVDALRADAMPQTEEQRADLPHLAALRRASRSFRHAFSPAAGTDLSLSTLITGQIDPFSGVDTTLAESLQAAGFATHAVLPREVLRYAGTTLLTRGLDTHDTVINDGRQRDVGSHATSDQTTDRGIEFLAQHVENDAHADARLFLWLHYFDVHEHEEIEADDEALAAIADGLDLEDRAQRYAATVRLVDRAVGRFLAELDRRHLADDTLVVFASDHGESLADDPRLPQNHGRVLYNRLIHVPLMFRLPGLDGSELAGTASLVDITPTIRSLFGLPRSAAEDGVSLRAFLDDPAPKGPHSLPRPIILHESDQRGAIVWPHKVLRRPSEGVVELFDLATDFDEQHDLSAVMPDLLARMLLELDAAPTVDLDRTRAGRRRREVMARPPTATGGGGS